MIIYKLFEYFRSFFMHMYTLRMYTSVSNSIQLNRHNNDILTVVVFDGFAFVYKRRKVLQWVGIYCKRAWSSFRELCTIQIAHKNKISIRTRVLSSTQWVVCLYIIFAWQRKRCINAIESKIETNTGYMGTSSK